MSNYLNYSIETRDGFRDYIVNKLGYPLLTIELTETQLNLCIDEALEIFSKYAYQDEEFYAVNLSGYSNGISLSGRNIAGITNIYDSYTTTLGNMSQPFSNINIISQMGAFPDMTQIMGDGGWISYELLMQKMDLTKMMSGGGLDFIYNPRDQILKLIPDPSVTNMTGYVILHCKTINNDDMNMGEYWVKNYALAEAKILLGTIRSKFEGVQLLGGGTINTSIKDDGKEERDKLLEEIQSKEAGPFEFYLM